MVWIISSSILSRLIIDRWFLHHSYHSWLWIDDDIPGTIIINPRYYQIHTIHYWFMYLGLVVMSSQADALNLAAVTCCQVPGGARAEHVGTLWWRWHGQETRMECMINGISMCVRYVLICFCDVKEKQESDDALIWNQQSWGVVDSMSMIIGGKIRD